MASRAPLPEHVVEHMDKLSKAEKEFIDLITDLEKDGRWASIAITKIEEATMAARRAFAMAYSS
jgi:hypothetical protein